MSSVPGRVSLFITCFNDAEQTVPLVRRFVQTFSESELVELAEAEECCGFGGTLPSPGDHERSSERGDDDD
jgi:Fe-S oxidoreductase